MLPADTFRTCAIVLCVPQLCVCGSVSVCYGSVCGMIIEGLDAGLWINLKKLYRHDSNIIHADHWVIA